MSQLPLWKCHKEVRAAKIDRVDARRGWLHVTDAEGAKCRVPVTDEYVEKHKPEAGGYYVVYEDGYESFSPAAAFEAGYTRVKEPTAEVLDASSNPLRAGRFTFEHAAEAALQLCYAIEKLPCSPEQSRASELASAMRTKLVALGEASQRVLPGPNYEQIPPMRWRHQFVNPARRVGTDFPEPPPPVLQYWDRGRSCYVDVPATVVV